MGLLDPNFIFNKRKPIPGEWEYDIHPGPYSQEQVYDAPLYQGEQWGLMDDWIPYEPTPYEPTPYEPTPATPPPTDAGVDPGEFFPIDDPPTEPLVSYFRPGSYSQGWALATISDYNRDYNDSQGGRMPYAPPGEIPSYLQRTPDQQDPDKLHDWGLNPWPEYADAEGYAEEAIQPFSRGPDGITPVWSWKNDGLLGIVGGGLIPDAGPISDSPYPTD